MTSKKKLDYKANYKKFWCICPSCSSVGTELIVKQYADFKNILLEDDI